ncbi:MAG: PaaI family thioesterase [Gemmobacter sp.]|jgi:1,4-dihydroxy-2-naphthoyl-CoA hydrolase
MPASPEKVARIIGDLPNFGRLLGLRITVADADRVEAELEVTSALLNRNGMIHGGAIMAFADTLGGTGTFLNLADGEGTVTVESKTNFFRAVAEGQMLRAVCLPLHRGRRTQVWQTTLTGPEGKLVAQVTQTQMVLTKD